MNRRKRLTIIFWTLIAVFLLLVLLYWLLVVRLREYTDDAYVEGNQVWITPLRSGLVTAIHTDDTFLVKCGQLLVELDKTDATIALAQASQDFATKLREVAQAYHQVFAYQAELEIRKAELIRSSEDYQHRAAVVAQEGVSLEDYQHAIADLRATYFSYKFTKTMYDKAAAYVQGTSLRNHPAVLSAMENVRNAYVQLFRSNIYAPVDGLVAQRTIQVGMWVQPSQPLMSVIPLDQIWVNANYKETQMKNMRIGQCVKLTSDLYGRGVVYHGQIVGLPGGAGNAFSLLPPQNLSGNWIKIVQRLPVRVALDPEELICHPLRLGLSMEAKTDLTMREGPLVPSSADCGPTYATTAYVPEEAGDCEWIEKIFCENLDPTLSQYAESPLKLQNYDLDFKLPEPICQIELGLDLIGFMERGQDARTRH